MAFNFEIQSTMKKLYNHLFFLFSIWVFIKFFFSIARVNEIYYFIYPVSKLTDFITATSSNYILNQGFYNEHYHYIINKSCAGINFFLMAFCTVSFRIFLSFKKKSLVYNCLISASIAYLTTIIANTSRIVCSIKWLSLSESDIPFHQSTGVVIYLCFLISIYLLVDFIAKKHSGEIFNFSKPIDVK